MSNDSDAAAKRQPTSSASKPPPSIASSVGLGLADAALEAIGATGRIVFAFVSLAAGAGSFFFLGERFGYWSPALGLAVVGLFALAGSLKWRLRRYQIATVIAGAGATFGAALGSTDGLGVMGVFAAALLVASCLLWSIVEAVLTS